MKRIFGRDKPKITKVTPASREILPGSGQIPVLEDQPQYPLAHHQHQTVREAVLQQQSMGRSSSDEHWEVVVPYREDVSYHQQPQPRDPKMQNLTESQSSSLVSLSALPPGASPPLPSPMQAPRSASPFTVASNATTVRDPRSDRPRQGEKDALLKKRPQIPGTGPGSPSIPTSTAALGILRALDPFTAHDATGEKEHRGHKLHDRHHSDEALHEEKKERKGFWGGVKEKEKEKGKERRDDDGQAELTRMIGYLTATASEDWSLVLEVCDRASASEANAKEAVKALRREFKYAEPSAQLSAARLWAIMLRNSSEIFMQQIMTKKFLDTLEDVLTSPRTSPVVRERLMDVLAAVAYASGSKNKNDPRADKEGFRGLWRRLKPADKPDEGVPFDIDDAMFNPPMPRPTSGYSMDPEEYFNQQSTFSQAPTEQQPLEQEPLLPHIPPRKSSMRRTPRIIPPEEDMRRLFQECKIGQGNASLLSEALAYAKPEDLVKKDIIKEFYVKCRSSQELIYAQIPWASAGAERSRQGNALRAANGSYPNLHSREDESPTESTVEEELLAALLVANEALLEALRLYDDLERVAVEREAEELSRRDVRMDRRQLQYQDNEHGRQIEVSQAHVGDNSSRTPSPSPTDSPAVSFQQPAYIPSITHPLPRIPLSGHTSNSSSTHLSGYSTQNAALLPPPPAPHGPRSPAPNYISSRTPSPDRFNLPPTPDHHSRTDSSASSKDYHAMRNGLSGLQIVQSVPQNDDDEDEVSTPIKPSAKALGKRKVVDVEEPDRAFDTDDMFYEGSDEPYPAEGRPDSDSDDVSGGFWNHTTHYVYDAAAERTQQRLRRGRVSTLVDGVH